MYGNSSPRSGLRWYFLLQKQVEMEGYLPLTSLVMLEMRLDQDWPFEANYRIVEISLDWFSTFWEELVLIFFIFIKIHLFSFSSRNAKTCSPFPKSFPWWTLPGTFCTLLSPAPPETWSVRSWVLTPLRRCGTIWARLSSRSWPTWRADHHLPQSWLKRMVVVKDTYII